MTCKNKLCDYRFCFIVLAINFAFFDCFYLYFDEIVIDVAFNMVRVLVFIYAGFILSRGVEFNFKSLFLVALSLSAFDHLFLKGGSFYLGALLVEGETFTIASTAFYGVLFSYSLNLPLSILLVYIGISFARFKRNRN